MTELEGANEALRSVEGLENEQQVSEFRKELDAIQNSRVDIEKDLAMREKELAEAKRKIGWKKICGISWFREGHSYCTNNIDRRDNWSFGCLFILFGFSNPGRSSSCHNYVGENCPYSR